MQPNYLHAKQTKDNPKPDPLPKEQEKKATRRLQEEILITATKHKQEKGNSYRLQNQPREDCKVFIPQ